MSINKKLLEDELNEFCQSESLSKDGLSEIIERHRAPPNNNNNDNKYDFFHSACDNERITEGILRYLLEYFPNAVRDADGYVSNGEERVGGCTPLHNICLNKNVTLNMVQLLIDAFPESLRHESNNGRAPLHFLCRNNDLDDGEIGLKILELLIMRCPESVKHASSDAGNLPIHFAAAWQPLEFCRMLIEAYPGSERMSMRNGILPFHLACALNTVATAEYFYKLYPESINVADNRGRYPIHFAIQGAEFKEYPERAVETVKFLLGCDPDVVLQKIENKVLLHWVCWYTTNNDNTPRINANRARLNVVLKVLQIFYDAHPEAIEDNDVTFDVGICCAEAQSFINTQLTYARQARDQNLINLPDENGQLPLHRALRDNITLGSIKLLVKGNPSAISCADNIGIMPLHVACQHNDSASIVEYLINLDPTSLHQKDLHENTALHYACRGANHAIIALLTEKYGAVSVFKTKYTR